MNDKIKNCKNKMYINLTDDEEVMVTKLLEDMESNFTEINHNFPNLTNEPVMTHTIEIANSFDNLREDDEGSATDPVVLFANAKKVTDNQIEVPKVVG